MTELEDVAVGGYSKHIDQEEFSLRDQSSPKDPLLAFLQEQEIRTILREEFENDELQYIAHYHSLSASGENDQVMLAIENSVIPLITDQSILLNGKLLRAERFQPERAVLLKQLKLLRDNLAAAIQIAKSELNLRDGSLEELAEGDSKPDRTVERIAAFGTDDK